MKITYNCLTIHSHENRSLYVSKAATSIFSLNKKVEFVLLSVFLITMAIVSKTAYASNDDDLSCFNRGTIDGEDHPFNQATYSKCGDDYYEGYIEGCDSTEGNTIDICESSTDK